MDSLGFGLWAFGFGLWNVGLGPWALELGPWALGVGIWELGVAVYVAGVVWGLIAIDARPAARLGLAVLWPIGPIAFVVTITALLIVSLIAFPLFGLAVLAAAGAMWWTLT